MRVMLILWILQRSMLASLAQQIRERQAGAGGTSEGDDGGEEGGNGGGAQTVYLDDNCEVRIPPFPSSILSINTPFLPLPYVVNVSCC